MAKLEDIRLNIVRLAAVAKLGIAADSYLSNAQRIISRSGVQIPPAACPRSYLSQRFRRVVLGDSFIPEACDLESIIIRSDNT